MTESNQERHRIPQDAKAMQTPMQQQPSVPMAHPPTAMRSPPPSATGTGYSIPPAGSPFAAAVAAVAKTALAPVITAASTMSSPTATVAITSFDQPSPTFPSLTSSPSTPLTSLTKPLASSAIADPLRPTQANSTPTSATTAAATTTATITTSITSATPPSSSTTAATTIATPPTSNSSLSTAPSIRPTSMTIDQSQWDHGPGGFPEMLGHTNYAYSTITTTTNNNSMSLANQGFDSALTSKNNSLEYPRDDLFSHISFLYANEKRFGDFHSLFRSVPDDEKLIEDYGCALQKEILVQGRLYISENHVCFHANIFGWVTTLVIAFSEITAIEKRLTAFVIPNAISIVTTTNTRGHFFASFLSRDAAHDLLMAAWRKSFPCAANASVANSNYSNGSSRQSRSTLVNDEDDNADAMSFISGRGNPASRRNRHRRSFSNASQSATGDEGTGKEDGVYWGGDDTGDAKTLDSGNNSLRRRGSKRAVLKKVLKGSLSPNSIPRKTGRGRSVSELPPRPTSFDGTGSRSSIDTARSSFDYESLSPPMQQQQRARAGTESLPNRRNVTVRVPTLVVPTAATNTTATTIPSLPIQQPQQQQRVQLASNTNNSQSPTTCRCSKENRHYANSYMCDTFPGTLESIWKLLFDCDFSKGFLTSDVMKGADVQEEPWQNAPDGTSTRMTRYTRWLGLPIGPKTTKAIVTDVCEHKDFSDYVTVVTTTSTPDVPSGGSFTTKVRTCLTWVGPNQVQVVVTGAVEFTKSSWIKGQIEKGAADGLAFHYKEVNPWMRRHIAAHPEEFAVGSNGSSSSAPAGQVAQTTSTSATATPMAPYVEINGGSGDKEDSPTILEQDSKAHAASVNSNNKRSTATPGSSLSLFSNIASAFSWDSSGTRSNKDGDDESDGGTISYWILLTALAMVMVANIYVWSQISGVSRQIEQIQNDILSVDQDQAYYQGRQHYSSQRQHQHRRQPLQQHWRSQADEEEAELDELEREEQLAREQEEAMWAWLTEREARHQRYRHATGVFSEGRAKVELTKRQQALREQERLQQQQQQQSEKSEAYVGLTATELKLQARINELQEQLMALDRQASEIKIDSLHVEQEVSSQSTSPS
ncbi:hypothetical protein EC991_007728 [Linnemannia zychae]|nr:hypothetical protein EC991_007728 [Linnemannia zychae]